jgi:dihydrodipicolinate synthase/N-acetylneuraminate lyase
MRTVKLAKEDAETARIAIKDMMEYLIAVEMKADGAIVVVANVIGAYYAAMFEDFRGEMLEDAITTIRNVCEKHASARDTGVIPSGGTILN